ncbi:UNVERIFIED_ORG: beta-galactosidase [Burkholderia sp. CF145]|uniref:beta-galactosidase n=1 Tax=Paraburkholderia hospita TaxID=169430 RepID=UPI000271697D|nr:beta-galactosidase [Paraburkholderia hospita]EUC18501.1 glycoside hydrolase family 35 [Burkholderia sp. BT03]SKD04175.1 Beta-galactosidase GanA [Paraburkholderia hospita]
MKKRASIQEANTAGPDGPHVFSFAANGDGFLLDGKPFQIRSGELHPARIPVEYWRHRIQMAKAMGMNTIALYVMWNYHELTEGTFDFYTDNRDIGAFIRLCQAENMWVLFRPGPYVCAEWDLGGIPSWLLKHTDIRLRTDRATDPRYMHAVERYINELLPRVKPWMTESGGPILMIQIENEFGSFDSNSAYLEEIRQLWIRGGIHGPFYTEDGLVQLQQNRSNVAGGAIALSNGNAAQIEAVRKAFPSVPAMAGEVYPGWLTHWGERAFQGTSVDLSATLDELMRKNLSFNLYVIHGGTSFGFYAGANVDADSGEYQPDITSYDYAAPVSEQGVATKHYMQYRSIIAGYLSTPLPPVPSPIETIPVTDATGTRRLMPQRYASIWDNLPAALPSAQTTHPQPFEMYGQAFGFVLYRKRLARYESGSLDIANVHDYATVFIGDQYVGGVSRTRMPEERALPLKVVLREPVALPGASSVPDDARVLEILVEGMGRVNYGHSMIDRKGIIDPVVLHHASGAREVLTGWEVVLLPMDESFVENLRPLCSNPDKAGLFFMATLSIDAVGDVYFDMSEWTKGIVWVNGHNLGRYWNIGPQRRLYCPAPWLKPGDNTVLIFDLHQLEAKPVSLASTLS